MPRMENSGSMVSEWHQHTDDGSSTFDLCRKCANTHTGKPLPRTLAPYHTNEPRGVLTGPCYCPWEDFGEWDDQRCDSCGISLTPANF